MKEIDTTRTDLHACATANHWPQTSNTPLTACLGWRNLGAFLDLSTEVIGHFQKVGSWKVKQVGLK